MCPLCWTSLPAIWKLHRVIKIIAVIIFCLGSNPDSSGLLWCAVCPLPLSLPPSPFVCPLYYLSCVIFSLRHHSHVMSAVSRGDSTPKADDIADKLQKCDGNMGEGVKKSTAFADVPCELPLPMPHTHSLTFPTCLYSHARPTATLWPYLQLLFVWSFGNSPPSSTLFSVQGKFIWYLTHP